LLSRFELLIGFLGAWLVSAAALSVLKRLRGKKLPSGAIPASKIPARSRAKAPGTRWSRIGVVTGMGVNSFLTLLVFFLLIFDLWNVAAPFIAFDLPTIINWVGMIGIWWADLWAIAVMYYNVNYIPCQFQPRGPLRGDTRCTRLCKSDMYSRPEDRTDGSVIPCM